MDCKIIAILDEKGGVASCDRAAVSYWQFPLPGFGSALASVPDSDSCPSPGKGIGTGSINSSVGAVPGLSL